jgi:D-glycero-alpha-D-manno-heptose-7-phosphate kinase
MEKIKKIKAVAPIRICDIGGWTDTWFAKYGAIFSIAVYPYVEVQIAVDKNKDETDRVIIEVENYGETIALNPAKITFEKHPLIEAAIDIIKIPKDLFLKINIFSNAPPGASTGTSAAVSIALLGALNELTNNKLTSHEIAQLAHSIETEKLKLQCGIQDQIASAYGGINFIEMHQFPYASVSPIQIPNSVWWELEQRISLIYIGTPHSSSEVHKKVIEELGCEAQEDKRLAELRLLARRAKEALFRADFAALGRVMNQNTEVQRTLHKDLVCEKFEEIMALTQAFNAIGCKVNGAGGDGGSITILSDGDMGKKRKMLAALHEQGFKTIPTYLSRYGLRVWKTA